MTQSIVEEFQRGFWVFFSLVFRQNERVENATERRQKEWLSTIVLTSIAIRISQSSHTVPTGIFFCMVCLQIAYEWGNFEDLWWSQTSNARQCMRMCTRKNDNNFRKILEFQIKSKGNLEKCGVSYFDYVRTGTWTTDNSLNFNITLKFGKFNALHFPLIFTHSMSKICWKKSICEAAVHLVIVSAMLPKPTNNFVKLWP